MATVGKIVDFDNIKQTATVQPLIKEYVKGEWKLLPKLLDVPCFFPRGGGYCLTFPVKPDDEVMVIFNDRCLDAWWQSGGEQTQLELRSHDLSDAMCLFGITSVPRAVTDYSTNSVMLRNEDNDSYFEIVDDDKTINIKGAEKLNIETDDDINIKTNAKLNIETNDDINIESANHINIDSTNSITINSSQPIFINSSRFVTITGAISSLTVP